MEDPAGPKLFAIGKLRGPTLSQEHPRTTSPSPIKVDVWSEVACPWCYLGKRRLENALQSFAQRPAAPADDVEYRSYQLNPDLPLDFEGTYSEYFQSRLGMSPAQLGASKGRLTIMTGAVGAEYHMDQVVISNPVKANELLRFARAHGKQTEMKERLFLATGQRGGA